MPMRPEVPRHDDLADQGDPACKVPHKQEDTMRNLTNRVLPLIIAAGLSGLMFTATLY